MNAIVEIDGRLLKASARLTVSLDLRGSSIFDRIVRLMLIPLLGLPPILTVRCIPTLGRTAWSYIWLLSFHPVPMTSNIMSMTTLNSFASYKVIVVGSPTLSIR